MAKSSITNNTSRGTSVRLGILCSTCLKIIHESYILNEWTVTCESHGGRSRSYHIGTFGMLNVIPTIKSKIVEYAEEHKVKPRALDEISDMILNYGSMEWYNKECGCRKFLTINLNFNPHAFKTIHIASLVT